MNANANARGCHNDRNALHRLTEAWGTRAAVSLYLDRCQVDTPDNIVSKVWRLFMSGDRHVLAKLSISARGMVGSRRSSTICNTAATRSTQGDLLREPCQSEQPCFTNAPFLRPLMTPTSVSAIRLMSEIKIYQRAGGSKSLTRCLRELEFVSPAQQTPGNTSSFLAWQVPNAMGL